MSSKIRVIYYLKSKEMIKAHTCFLNLKLNSHIGSCLFPTIFLHQKSKHCKKIKITVLFASSKASHGPNAEIFYFGTDRNPHLPRTTTTIWHWCNMKRDNPKAIQ